MAIKFHNRNLYYITAELPLTGRIINLMYISDMDDWEKYTLLYRRYFSKMNLVEFNVRKPLGQQIKIMSTRSNNNIKETRRIVIPRIKKQRKKPLKGNLCINKTDTIAYIQVSDNKSRKILKIDLEDLPILENVCKSSFYFISRPRKAYASNYVLSKKKSRIHSIYSYIFGKPIFSDVIHLDGDYTNYCKSNLKIMNSCRLSTTRKTIKLQNEHIINNRNVDELVGYTANRDGYYARIIVNGKRINVGRTPDKETSAKLYDLGRIYYLGKGAAVNYPFNYYFTFEHNLVVKTFTSLKNRKNGLKSALAQELLDYFIEDVPQKEKT